MSHATFRDLPHHFDEDEPLSTSCAAVRYNLDFGATRRFKLQRSNAEAFRRAVGTKPRRPLSK